MKKINFILSIILFVTLLGCKTVTTKVDKTISEEEQKLSKFLNKTTDELKIEFGEPDLIETTDKENKHFVYLKSKLKIEFLIASELTILSFSFLCNMQVLASISYF